MHKITMFDIYVFGGSITFGDYDKSGGWVNKLGAHLLTETPTEKNRRARVYNLSISGETSGGVLKRLIHETRARHRIGRKLIYVFHIGLNDSILINGKAKISEQSFKNNISKLISKSKGLTDKIIFIGPPPVDEKKVSPMPWSPTEYYYSQRISIYTPLT